MNLWGSGVLDTYHPLPLGAGLPFPEKAESRAHSVPGSRPDQAVAANGRESSAGSATGSMA